MHICIVTCGLIGRGYHGGSMTCWGMVNAALTKGHKVTLLSLYETSKDNPHLKWKDIQLQGLKKAGIAVEMVEFEYCELRRSSPLIYRCIGGIFCPKMRNHFQWAKLSGQTEEKLKKIKPDAIFCFHFDALSAIYKTKIAPITFDAGDLWHLPPYFRWKAKPLSVKKYLIDGIGQLIIRRISKKLMIEMMRDCKCPGASAAHYAEWFKRFKGLENTLYFRTPVQDPVGGKWKDKMLQYAQKREKAKIIFVGNLSATATRWALRFLVREVVPELEKKYDMTKLEIHHIGLGKLGKEFESFGKLPYVRMRGYVENIDGEFLDADLVLEPTPVDLGIRSRIVTSFSYGSCVVTHLANTAGIPEIVHNENALVSVSGDGFANEIVRALNDVVLRRRLQENARKTFEKYFSEESAGGYMVEILEGSVWGL